MGTPPAQSRRCHAGLLVLILLVAAMAYAPGSSGPLHYDDSPNLAGLADVDDWSSALVFTLTGEAGPLGRPLALATFLPYQSHWPEKQSIMLWANILIHLFNGFLVAWLALRLGLVQGLQRTPATYLALLTCSIWLLMPLLASSSLLLVQRMTTLSASFVLLGLIGFLHARHWLDDRPRRAFTGMTLSLVLFTPLAALTKENGALLPLFALVITLTLLPAPPPDKKRAWHLWSLPMLWLPVAGLLILFVTRLPYPESTLFMRDFSAWERLLTQAGILWQYLFHAYIPTDMAFFGPFHDDYQPARSLFEPLTLLAVLAWIATLTAAVCSRRQAPVFTFAVAWYLTGHLLESTLLPLDLYFEHRNYVPLIGPTFALAWLIVHVPGRYRRAVTAATTAYVGLLALTLWIMTSQWGSPLVAAENQYRHNPGSSRALGHYSNYLLAMDMVDPVLDLLDQAVEKEMSPERFLASRIYFQCRHQPDRKADSRVADLITRLPQATPDRNLTSTLHGLIVAAAEYDCETISPEQGAAIIKAFTSHPMYDYEGSYWYHFSLAKLARAAGNAGSMRHHLELAVRQRFHPEPMKELVDLYIQDKRYRPACDLIQELWRQAPAYPLKRLGRHLQLRQFVRQLNQAGGNWQCEV